MTVSALEGLIDNIQVECLDVDLFRGDSTFSNNGRALGGQVLAQAMYASNCTVDQRFILHSVHSNFLLPGDAKHPLFFRVDRMRDGKSFRTRRVEVIQHGKVICHLTTSYQLPEPGLEHQSEMPFAVLNPDALVSDRERFEMMLGDTGYTWPIEFRQVDPVSLQLPDRASTDSHIWFKASGEVVGRLDKHQELLAYATDSVTLLTALRPHGVNPWVNDMQLASLDHALWFHRPFRIDEWMLYEMNTHNAFAGRGLVFGKVYDRGGRLVASVAQEGLIRMREESAS